MSQKFPVLNPDSITATRNAIEAYARVQGARLASGRQSSASRRIQIRYPSLACIYDPDNHLLYLWQPLLAAGLKHMLDGNHKGADNDAK